MATDPDLTFDDIQGCLTYMAHYRAARSSLGLDRVEKERLLRNHTIEIAKTMTPSFLRALLHPQVDGTTFDALIADLLDTPMRDPRVSFSILPHRSSSARANKKQVSARPTQRRNQEPSDTDAGTGSAFEVMPSYQSNINTVSDMESAIRSVDEATSSFQKQGAEISITAPFHRQRSKPGYSPAPASEVTCTICNKRLACRSKVC